jgi:hypothetical protein
MSRVDWQKFIPAIARYRREPVEDRRNALFYWDRAASELVPFRDARLCEALVCGDSETGELADYPTGGDADRIREFLDQNKRALELLRDGVGCDRFQVPAPEEEVDIAESLDSMHPLVELANTWLILARALIAEHDFPAAASELAGLGEMAERICCGEGLVIHYLIGSNITDRALAGLRLLAACPNVAAGVLKGLTTKVQRWLDQASRATQCMKVDLCLFSLPEMERLAACQQPQRFVDELLDRHYANDTLLPLENGSSRLVREDGRLTWRRERILYLLQGHPSPFDRIATVRLMGRTVADRIQDLKHTRTLSPLARFHRLARAYRRARYQYRLRVWPAQLQSGFPFEYLGHGQAARELLARSRPHLSPEEWARVQPPSDDELKIVRQRLQTVPNPLGLLTADALLATDITKSERTRRQRLKETRRALG